ESVVPGALGDWHAGEYSSLPWGAFDPIHAPNAAVAELNGLLAGLSLGTLDPWGAMTREEAAQLLDNVRVFVDAATPIVGRGTASDAALVAAIRTGWPDIDDDVFLPAALPDGWRFQSRSDFLSQPVDEEYEYENPGFWYVPMGWPPSICGYAVVYTKGQDTISVSSGYWPASGGSRYLHSLAENAPAVDIFLEGDQWLSFTYPDSETGLPAFQVLLVDSSTENWYVEIDYPSESTRAAAEAIARSIARVPSS
ncbi:MAG: hypothetical protein JW990_11665, partial [Thermoleophilia bacterium]|nr:hypothetical protein [Thermoleophilia bacterium]